MICLLLLLLLWLRYIAVVISLMVAVYVSIYILYLSRSIYLFDISIYLAVCVFMSVYGLKKVICVLRYKESNIVSIYAYYGLKKVSPSGR